MHVHRSTMEYKPVIRDLLAVSMCYRLSLSLSLSFARSPRDGSFEKLATFIRILNVVLENLFSVLFAVGSTFWC